MLFEIIDLPAPDSDGEEGAGPDPPPEQHRALAVRQTAVISKASSIRATSRHGSETRLRRRHLRL